MRSKLVVMFLAAAGIIGATSAQAGTTNRIAKFTGATTVGDSVLYEIAGKIGLGTTSPVASLDIRSSYGLSLTGAHPVMTMQDTDFAASATAIQSQNGGMTFFAATAFSGSPNALVRLDRAGRVGFGTRNPLRQIQIGPSTDALFTIEGSDASPRAGFIRFGDKTGWQLRIGRSRETSGGPLNTGLTGATFTFRDDGAFGPTSYPLLATGVEPLCRTLANFITRCQASSLRYKTNIAPYTRGLDVINGLRPIEFTRILSGARDIGLAAEEVATVEPRLTFRNEDNQIEGIRYELISAVFINAIKEQQTEIESQRRQIDDLRAALDRLEKAVSAIAN